MKETIKRIINEILSFCLNNKFLSIIVRTIYNFFIKIGILLNNEEIKDEKLDYEKVLQEYSPRPEEKTYYGKNKIISEEYDLQIVIPAYNVEKYIEDCIESILKQKTKYKVLIVIVNDGSTDNTKKILEKYEKNSNIEIINQKNQGISEARNKGLEKLRSKYIMFVDSDDILFQDAVENLLSIATINNLDIVEGSFKRLYLDKTFEGGKHKDSFISDSEKETLFGFPWGKVIKSEIFNNLKFPLKYNYEDSIFAWLIYPKKYKVKTISRDVYLYRVNQKSISYYLKENKRSVETFYIMKELLENGINLYGINIDKNLFLNFLGQIKLNYTRTINCPEEIKKAIFFETKKLLENNFGKFNNIENYLDKELVKSLKENNYERYKFICKYGRKL